MEEGADMNLTLTRYLDAEPDSVTDKLPEAVEHALDAAARRISVQADHTATDDTLIEQEAGSYRMDRGLQVLEGSTLRVSGGPRLTTLEISVPWTADDRHSKKLLAANAFAQAVATEVDAAA